MRRALAEGFNARRVCVRRGVDYGAIVGVRAGCVEHIELQGNVIIGIAGPLGAYLAAIGGRQACELNIFVRKVKTCLNGVIAVHAGQKMHDSFEGSMQAMADKP